MITPQLTYSTTDVKVSEINSTLGLNLTIEEITKYLDKMGLKVTDTKEEGKVAVVEVPPTRSDILHACDVAEDVGIAYGYNNITKVFPPTNTIGKQVPENKFSELLR